MTRTWLFGEAEYESTENYRENFLRLFKCGEACGYMIEAKPHPGVSSLMDRTLVMDGSDLEHVVLAFKGDDLVKIYKRQYTDRTGKMELVSNEELVINR